MRIPLGTFARSAIEARLGCEPAAGVRAALLHYTRRLRAGERAPAFPSFLRERPMNRSEADLELAIDPEILEVLESEARESPSVSVEQLTVHAVFIYLADVDKASERATQSLVPH